MEPGTVTTPTNDKSFVDFDVPECLHGLRLRVLRVDAETQLGTDCFCQILATPEELLAHLRDIDDYWTMERVYEAFGADECYASEDFSEHADPAYPDLFVCEYATEYLTPVQ